MNLRFINGRIHGLLDYAVAVTLLIVPFGLNFQASSPIAHWISVAAGIALFLYSILTDYSLSFGKVIPLGFHLTLDFLAGVAFVIAPFLFSFDGIARWFYLVTGIAVIAVVLLTEIPAHAK